MHRIIAAVVVTAVTLPGTSGPSVLGVGFTLTATSADFPNYDPDGSQLRSIMEAAASRYSRILRDAWTMEIDYGYAPPGSFVGIATSAPIGHVEFAQQGGEGRRRTVFGRIRFRTDINWYFDPTPLDDVEFELAQIIYADVPQIEKSIWFAGSAPAGLEVGFAGTNPVIGGIDVLSIALHELGHLLGVNSTFGEAADGDYDFLPAHVGGATTSAMAIAGDHDHLAATSTLLRSSFGRSTRVLPTATDVLAMAAASGWQQIDLSRKEFWGGGAWHDPFRWAGNRVPDADDDVYVRFGAEVTLGEDAVAGRLFLDHGARLSSGGHRLLAREVHLGRDSLLDIGADVVLGESLYMDATSTLALVVGETVGAALVFPEEAHLAGRVEIAWAGSYQPEVGDRHPLLITRELSGEFDFVAMETARSDSGVDVLLKAQTIGPVGGGKFVQLVAEIVHPGDVNADGSVDQADLDAVLLGWGRPVVAASIGSGDLDGNGLIDQADLDRVLLNWGAVAALHTAARVPEPGTSVLLLLTAVLLPYARSLRSVRAANAPVQRNG